MHISLISDLICENSVFVTCFVLVCVAGEEISSQFSVGPLAFQTSPKYSVVRESPVSKGKRAYSKWKYCHWVACSKLLHWAFYLPILMNSLYIETPLKSPHSPHVWFLNFASSSICKSRGKLVGIKCTNKEKMLSLQSIVCTCLFAQ